MTEALALSEYCRMVEASQPEWVELVRSRPYQMPKGYIPWHRLSVVVAVNLALVKAGLSVLANEDLPTRITAWKLAQWFLQDASLYCISIELLRAFERADLSNIYELFKGFETRLPTFLIALPENAITTQEGGNLALLHEYSEPLDTYRLSIKFVNDKPLIHKASGTLVQQSLHQLNSFQVLPPS